MFNTFVSVMIAYHYTTAQYDSTERNKIILNTREGKIIIQYLLLL